MNNMETTETTVILQELPDADQVRKEYGTTPGSAYFKLPPPNAWVARSVDLDGIERLEIYPIDGGYLEVSTDLCVGDLAPFCD